MAAFVLKEDIDGAGACRTFREIDAAYLCRMPSESHDSAIFT